MASGACFGRVFEGNPIQNAPETCPGSHIYTPEALLTNLECIPLRKPTPPWRPEGLPSRPVLSGAGSFAIADSNGMKRHILRMLIARYPLALDQRRWRRCSRRDRTIARVRSRHLWPKPCGVSPISESPPAPPIPKLPTGRATINKRNIYVHADTIFAGAG